MPIFEIERNGEVLEVEAPDEATALSAVAPVTDPRQSAAGGFGSMIPGLPQAAGGLNYALEGGAEGAYDRGVQGFEDRLGQAEQDNPRAFLAGQVGSVAVPGPAIGAAAVPSAAARVAESLLKWGGRLGQGVTAYNLFNGNLGPKEIAMGLLGTAMHRGGKAMTSRRVARSRGTTRQDIDEAHARGEYVTMTPNKREPEALTPEEYVAKYGPDSNAFRNAQELKRRLEIDELERRRDTLNLYGNDVPPPWVQ